LPSSFFHCLRSRLQLGLSNSGANHDICTIGKSESQGQAK
jgi:hypothetical protein